jgi:hypothetical protein
MTAQSPQSPLNVEAQRAGQRLAGLHLTRIVGEPDRADALNLVDDLDAICRIVDALIERIGDYAMEHFPGIDRDLFRDQLRGALFGNATYVLESAADEISSTRSDKQADLRRGLLKAE